MTGLAWSTGPVQVDRGSSVWARLRGWSGGADAWNGRHNAAHENIHHIITTLTTKATNRSGRAWRLASAHGFLPALLDRSDRISGLIDVETSTCLQRVTSPSLQASHNRDVDCNSIAFCSFLSSRRQPPTPSIPRNPSTPAHPTSTS